MKVKLGKLPGFIFYTGDWLKDPLLRCCSAGARGLWIDLLSLMFECPTRGVLAYSDGRPWTDEEIASSVSGPDSIDAKLVMLAELTTRGVARRNKRNALFSARMRRDDEQRVETKERVRNYRKRKCNANVTPLYEDENERELAVDFDVGSKSKAKPSFEEVSAYCLERKNSVDPHKWFDYYSANGWKVGRNAMKDWKAAIRTWEKTGKSRTKSDEHQEAVSRIYEKLYGPDDVSSDRSLLKLQAKGQP